MAIQTPNYATLYQFSLFSSESSASEKFNLCFVSEVHPVVEKGVFLITCVQHTCHYGMLVSCFSIAHDGRVNRVIDQHNPIYEHQWWCSRTNSSSKYRLCLSLHILSAWIYMNFCSFFEYFMSTIEIFISACKLMQLVWMSNISFFWQRFFQFETIKISSISNVLFVNEDYFVNR